jgi:hypothetical protein
MPLAVASNGASGKFTNRQSTITTLAVQILPSKTKMSTITSTRPSPAATVVAGSVEGAASKPAEASEQDNDQDDEQNGSDRHGIASLWWLVSIRLFDHLVGGNTLAYVL